MQCALLKSVLSQVCKNTTFDALLLRISEVVQEETMPTRRAFMARVQQCFAVKKGVDSFLDMARSSLEEITEAIYALADRLRTETGYSGLQMNFSARKGFTVSIPTADIRGGGRGRLPATFQSITTSGKKIICTTQELVSLNLRLQNACNECYMLSEDILEGLCEHLKEHLPALSLLSESVSLLDMLVTPDPRPSRRIAPVAVFYLYLQLTHLPCSEALHT